MTKHLSQRSAYGTGLIALDIVISASQSQPIRAWSGGTCGNVLTILGFLGWDSYPIARLNNDVASLRVKSDLQRWGIHLDFAECTPTSTTPIIVQQIHLDKNGTPKHKFTWTCPHCGHWFPGFKPVTVCNISKILPEIRTPKVFFMDRLSRAALLLAKAASEKGAIVVFEPSAKMDNHFLSDALQLAHIVKYSEQRFRGIANNHFRSGPVQVEIQTLGANGLRYRSRLPKARSNGWVHLSAFPVHKLADTCGAGDWCTAGLISMIATKGLVGLQQLESKALYKALRYGQAIAAWACGFEGARGGMYAVCKKTFHKQINLVLEGRPIVDNKRSEQQLDDDSSQGQIICPSCSES